MAQGEESLGRGKCHDSFKESKPDRKIYEIALSETGKRSEECFFIDNSVKNLIVAEELGIKPVLFNRDQEEYGGLIVNDFSELAGLVL